MNGMMKRVCGILAGVATLFAAWGGVSVASADEAVSTPTDLTTDVTLLVNGTSELPENIKLKAVKLASYTSAVTDADTRQVSSYDLSTVPALTSDIKSAVDETTPGNKATVGNPMLWVVKNYSDASKDAGYSGDLRTFLNHLKDKQSFTKAVESGIDFDFERDHGTVVDQTAVEAMVSPGVYAIVDTTPVGNNHQSAAIIAMTGTGIHCGSNPVCYILPDGSHLGEVDYKVNDPTDVAKTITAITAKNGKGEDVTIAPEDKSSYGVIASGKKSAATQLDADITFTLTSLVPNAAGYDKFYYGFTDTPSTGLTIDPDSVEVTVGVNKLDKADYHASVDPKTGVLTIYLGTETDGIAGAKANRAKFSYGNAVTVTYKARLNSKAAPSDPDKPEENKVVAEYSHNPNTWTDHKTSEEQKTKVFTGKFTVQKTDMSGNPLEGATFRLSRADDDSTAIKFVKLSDGYYRVATRDDKDGTTQDLVVGTGDTNKGLLTIDGVDGLYRLEENGAPKDYSTSFLPSANVTVTVEQSSGLSDAHITTSDPYKLMAMHTPTAPMNTQIDVKNARNITEMPKTGAVWLVIWITAAVLLGLAGALLLVRGRKTADRRH